LMEERWKVPEIWTRDEDGFGKHLTEHEAIASVISQLINLT
jgi:hypothetical protein